ncbi:MAG: hypothetical protein FWF79_09425 [Defluviitaleaceae bacterium]|nr:hypothetical protein [Defluviitaleaceae bacterium]
MEKTKLGISISLLGGGMYFIGLIGGLVPLLIVAGYVMIVEENQWLRRVAVKAVAVVLMFGVLSQVVSLFSDSSSFLGNLVHLFDGTINLLTYNRIITLVNVAISFLRTVILLILGFKALKMSDLGVPVDGVVNKNI